MAVVTVVGASGAHVKVSVDGASALALAKSYAAIVNGEATRGNLYTKDLESGVPQGIVPHGKFGEAVLTTEGVYSVHSFRYVTDPLSTPVILLETTIASSMSVLAGTGGTTLLGGSGGGAFIAGGGNNLFSSLAQNSGNYVIGFGNGNDTILALSGSDLIYDGKGSSTIVLGSGTSKVYSDGTDSIVAGSGHDSIHVDGNRSTVLGSTGKLFVLLNGTDESVVGGGGADTFSASTGDSTLTGGAGPGTLFEFTESKAGGHFTITDFGSAAGNMVSLFGYGANEVQTALATAKNLAGGSIIHLSDNTTVTFNNVSADYLKANADKFSVVD